MKSKVQEFHNRMKVLSDAAIKYIKQYNYDFVQRNGQRWSTLKSVRNPPSDNSMSEVFVGRIPRDMFEDEIFPIFSSIGVIYKIRLMMDFSGSNRGFGFIKFMNERDARRAVEILDEKYIRADAPPIGVVLSFNNRRLFFSKLPSYCTRELLLTELRKTLDAVEDVEMMTASGNLSRSDTRSAIVTFKNHEAATQARRVLVPSGAQMFNKDIIVDWAKRDDNKENQLSMRKPSTSFSSSTGTVRSELQEFTDEPPKRLNKQKVPDIMRSDLLGDLNNNLSGIVPITSSPPMQLDYMNSPYNNCSLDESLHQKYLLHDQLATNPPSSWLEFFQCVDGIFSPNMRNQQNSFNLLH